MLTKPLENGVWICLIFYIESISKRYMSQGVHRGALIRGLIGAREQQDTRGRWCSRGVVHMGECSDFDC